MNETERNDIMDKMDGTDCMAGKAVIDTIGFGGLD